MPSATTTMEYVASSVPTLLAHWAMLSRILCITSCVMQRLHITAVTFLPSFSSSIVSLSSEYLVHLPCICTENTPILFAGQLCAHLWFPGRQHDWAIHQHELVQGTHFVGGIGLDWATQEAFWQASQTPTPRCVQDWRYWNSTSGPCWDWCH